VDTVEKRIKEITNNFSLKVYFPHRLDKWATGLLTIAFDSLTASRLSKSLAKGMWYKRYRVIAQIPKCFCNAKKENAKIPNICKLQSQHLTGDFLIQTTENTTWENFKLKRKGYLISWIEQQSRFNQPEKIETDCPHCYGVIKHKKHHRYIIRHLLYRSVVPPNGKKSVTQYVLQNVNWDKGLVLYEAILKTGRTHQLRIHFADAGFPIVGDVYYNPYYIQYLMRGHQKNKNERVDDFELPTHLGLQAFLIELPHPHLRQTIKVTLDIPESWKISFPLNTIVLPPTQEETTNTLISDSDVFPQTNSVQ